MLPLLLNENSKKEPKNKAKHTASPTVTITDYGSPKEPGQPLSKTQKLNEKKLNQVRAKSPHALVESKESLTKSKGPAQGEPVPTISPIASLFEKPEVLQAKAAKANRENLNKVSLFDAEQDRERRVEEELEKEAQGSGSAAAAGNLAPTEANTVSLVQSTSS